MNHLVDDTPVGKAAEIAVINENIGSELSRLPDNFIRVVADLRMVRIDGVKLDPAGGTPFDSLFEQIAFANRPEDEPMAFGDQQFQCRCGNGISFPISGYLCSTIVPSKSIAMVMRQMVSINSGETETRATDITPFTSITTFLDLMPLSFTNIPSQPWKIPPVIRTF